MLVRQIYGYKDNLYRNINKKIVLYKINLNGFQDVFVMIIVVVCELVK